MDRVIDIPRRKREPIEPPHIDATSWRLLMELSADLAACQAGAQHPSHHVDLQRIAVKFDNLLQRFAPSKGAA
ncbi:MAG: hypothetical protein ACOH2I_01145 [Pseudomonas sp.]